MIMGRKKGKSMGKQSLAALADSVYDQAEKDSAVIGKFMKESQKRRR